VGTQNEHDNTGGHTLTDWISTGEAARLLGVTLGSVAGMGDRGHLTNRQQLEHAEGSGFTWRYDRAEVEALRDERIATGHQSADPIDADLGPLCTDLLRVMVRLGGHVEHTSNATGIIAENLPGGRTQTMSTALRDLDALGFIDRDISGKRTRSITLTALGWRWVNTHQPEPEPAPEPEREVIERSPVHVPVEAFPRADAEPPPAVEPNEFASTDPGAIAGALLRSVVRTLNDTETATLVAERDALRVHNSSLLTRLDQVTRDRDRTEAENRELRGILHAIEMQLAPMVSGQGATDWLDAQTRTDLMALIGAAAQWATAS
jgi:hypothetical protein